MKKQLLNLSACAVLLVLASIAFADPLVPPVRVLEIPYAGQSEITIDGTADAVYSAVQSTDAFNPTGSTGADADFTFSFQVAYNPLYLYIYGEILDDFENSLNYTTDSFAFTYDCVEVFINLDTVGSLTAAYDSNTIQLRISRGIDSIQTPGRATQEEYMHHWENTATGWLFETAIPWTCVLGENQSSDDFENYLDFIHGFDVHGYDSDTLGPGHRDCQTAWDSDDPDDAADRTEDNAWNNRTVFGVVTLAANYWEWPCWPYCPGMEIEEITSKEEISIYPNPVGSTLHFEAEGLNLIRIYSLTGVKLIEEETTGEVDISGLKSGMYLAEINGNRFAKFIKE